MAVVSSRTKEKGIAPQHVAVLVFVISLVGLINMSSTSSGDLLIAQQNGVLASSKPEKAQDNHGNIRRLETGSMESSVQNPLGIPQGQAVALPSLRVETQEVTRGSYGGEGDKPHLGGFTAFDGHGVSPQTWDHMITDTGVKSLIDVGCGKGVSTLYFALQGVDVLCLEGSHDAVTQSLLPDPVNQVVEHDFSRGPYWPGKTYDAVWSVEFLEHVGRNFQYNYIQAFRKAAYIFVSHSKWGGWHHVEVHDQDWWVQRMQMYGFQYSERMTEQIREVAKMEKYYANQHQDEELRSIRPDGKPYNGQHIWLNMLVFINPVVASLPEHAHLMAGPGCFKKKEEVNGKRITINKECDGAGETDLPESFKPLKLKPEGRQIWLDKVKASIEAAQTQ